jgi:hypothetical protein
MYSYLCAAWQLLTQPQLATWLDAPGEPILSPLNRYLSYNLDRWARGNMPSRWYPATETGSPPARPTYVVQGLIRHLSHLCAGRTPHNVCGILFYRSATPGFTPGPQNLTLAIPATLSGTGNLDTNRDEPCEPGTWYIRSRWITDTGKNVLTTPEASRIVTDI